MKKIFAVLMLSTMLFAVGCGNQAQNAAKDAQQKVEQKADEVKKDAEAKVDDAKDKAAEIKDDAEAKVDDAKDKAAEIKDDAATKVDEVKEQVEELTNEATSTITERVVTLGGLMPGVSVEDVKAMFGEPTSTEGNVLTFADGLKVILDGAQKVKSISTMVETFDTNDGMYVGADEYLLNEYCGPADSVNKITNGAEYKYNSGDKKSVVVYKAENGIITEITCSLK